MIFIYVKTGLLTQVSKVILKIIKAVNVQILLKIGEQFEFYLGKKIKKNSYLSKADTGLNRSDFSIKI